MRYRVSRSRRHRRKVGAREAKYLASFGYFAPKFTALAPSLAVLGACAVGPDFAVPPAPPVSGYTRDTPATTVSAKVAAGAAQHFGIGRDIPAEWWKVFHSNEIDALIAEALHANPTLQAAQATLWQAKETLYASGGKLLPTVDGERFRRRRSNSRPAEFGQSGSPQVFNLYQATVNVSYAPDVFGGQRRQIEANAALAEYQRFELEATY